MLIMLGADVNARNDEDWTPLHFAARYNSNAGIVKILVESGAKKDAVNDKNMTPFHYAKRYYSNASVL